MTSATLKELHADVARARQEIREYEEYKQGRYGKKEPIVNLATFLKLRQEGKLK